MLTVVTLFLALDANGNAHANAVGNFAGAKRSHAIVHKALCVEAVFSVSHRGRVLQPGWL